MSASDLRHGKVNVVWALVLFGFGACQAVADIEDRWLVTSSTGGATAQGGDAWAGAEAAASSVGTPGSGGVDSPATSTAGGSTQVAMAGGAAGATRDGNVPSAGHAGSLGGGGTDVPGGGVAASPSDGRSGATSAGFAGSAGVSGASSGGSSIAASSGGADPGVAGTTGAIAGGNSCVSPGTEDCTDSVDNDCNGMVDCADPSCHDAGYACVSVPSGWRGPVAVWEGNPGTAPAACPAGLEIALESVFSGLEVPDSDCRCTCGAATEQACGPAQIELFSNSVCENQCASASAASGDCGTIENGSRCGATFSAWSAAPIPTGGNCEPQVVATLPDATWNTELKACGAVQSAEAGGCEDPLDRCVPAAELSTPYGSERCVYQYGVPPTDGCPAAYPRGPSILYSDIEDTRQCTGCTCGSPTGGTCTGTIAIHERARCDGTPQTYTLGLGCQLLSLPTSTATTISADFVVSEPGICSVQSQGELTGNVSGTQPLTLCCAS